MRVKKKIQTAKTIPADEGMFFPVVESCFLF